MRSAFAGTVARVAPWGLAFAQSWLLGRLLEQARQRRLAGEKLHARLARVEQLLDPLAEASLAAGRVGAPSAPDPAKPAATPSAACSADAIVYRAVTLENGVSFEVALDGRRGDPIAEAVAAGETWFLDDYYVLLDLVKPGDRVLDLGGHIGTFALAAAALGGRVVCVEAAPENVRFLQAGVARNGFDRLLVIHGAATDREGMLEFLPHGPWGTIANPAVARVPSLIQANALAPVAVPALTVDALLARLGWDRVDLVKMDIEGSEVAAIRGMARLLSRPDGPTLLYESNADALRLFGETPAGLAEALRRSGYREYIVEPGRLVPTRPDELRPECVVNCLAAKGTPPPLDGRRVSAPRSPEETIRRIVLQWRSQRAYDRAHLARVLATADAAVLSDPNVEVVLWALCRDADEAVRAAAAWSLTSEGWAAGGAGGRA